MLCSFGGTANSGALTTLAQEGDAILSDRLNHAGTIDACRLSRAETVTFANRDITALEEALGGASGGFVAGPRDVIETLRAKSRGFIFTQGMTTANAATALAAVRAATARPELRTRLMANVGRLRASLSAHGLPLHASDSAIIAVRIGDEDRARALSLALRGEGIQAPAVAYPIVARGQARLRLQPSAAHAEADLDSAAAQIAALVKA